MQIYTRKGDNGTTQLIGGQRVSKNHDQVNAYGEVDELNAFIGGILAHLPGDFSTDSAIYDELYHIQLNLFDIGACLAISSKENSKPKKTLTESQIEILEKAIDRMSSDIPPLKAFILPAGHTGAVFSHLARTVCRRAERRVVGLIENSAFSDRHFHFKLIQKYLNRLSDFFFVLARYLNHRLNIDETIVDQKRCMD